MTVPMVHPPSFAQWFCYAVGPVLFIELAAAWGCLTGGVYYVTYGRRPLRGVALLVLGIVLAGHGWNRLIHEGIHEQ